MIRIEIILLGYLLFFQLIVCLRLQSIINNRFNRLNQGEGVTLNDNLNNIIWWDLFKPQSDTNINPIAIAVKNSSLPTVSAWRISLNTEPDEILDPPPSLIDYIRQTIPLNEDHTKKITELTSIFMNSISPIYRESDKRFMIEEAIRVAYIALWGRKTVRYNENSWIYIKYLFQILRSVYQ